METNNKHGRVVVITGAGGGMGSAFVRRFLGNGDTVIAVDVDNKKLEDITATHQAEPLFTAVRADIVSEEDCERIAEIARAQSGRVDILINCAGYFPIVPFEKMSPAEWRQVIDINLTGNFLVTRAVLPLLKGRDWGRIINIGSASVFEGVAGQAHYVAAKAGIIGFSRSLARELGEFGITVNIITPGLTMTPPVRANIPQAMIEKARGSRALKRDETAADLAGAVFFLGSRDADFVTGQIINVDGGSQMH